MEEKFIYFLEEYTKKTDRINKRLTWLCAVLSLVLVVFIASYCIRDSQIVHSYFYSGYIYGNMTQSSTSGDNQTAIGGTN